MDKIIFNGNLGNDPEQKTMSDGKTLVKLNVAVTHKVKGEKQTEWRQVTCYGKTGEFAMQYLKKGRSVLIEGRPSPRAYKNKLEELICTIDVWADNIEPLGALRDAEPGQPAPSNTAGMVEVTDENLPF